MGFKYLIFDVDSTLLNFGIAYAGAQRAIADTLGQPYTPEFISLDEKLSWKSWGEFRLDRVDLEDVQVHYHKYYYTCLRQHFTSLLEALHLPGEPEKLVDRYLEAVSASCVPMEEDTVSVYQKLAAAHQMVLATNGVSRVQRSRLRPFLPYTAAVFISEELGCIKPAKGFFARMLAELACRPEECLMIGDSLSSDIEGAMAVNIPACWYNPKGKEAPENIQPAYVVHSIRELLGICF